MAFYNNVIAGAAGAGTAADFKIERSLRIDDISNATLTRTPSTAGNRKTWTLSFWVKRTEIGGAQLLFNAGNTSTGDHSVMRFNGDMFQMYQYGHNGDTTAWSGGNGSQLRTSAVFRDPSAWMHIVVAMDTTQATQSDRLKYYINGVLQTQFDSTSYPAQNSNPGYWNAADLHCWGGQVSNSSPSGTSDYYLAEVHMVDGQQLAATDFGEFDAGTGVWNPIKFTGSYTTSGVSFDFAEQQLYAGGTREALFDGSTSTGCNFQKTTASDSADAPSNTKRIKVTFPTAKTGVTKLRIYGGGNTSSTNKVWYNDDVSTMITNDDPVGWKTVYTGSAITINSISFGTSNGGSNLRAIEINDVVLTDAIEQGLNSFHLDFSDNSSNAALGNDAAGSNDWTVNNITAKGVTYSDDLTASTGGFGLSSTAGDAFDGSLTTSAYSPSGGSLTWTPSTPISYSSSVEAYSYQSPGDEASLNGGTAVSLTSGQWTTVASGSGTITSLVVSDSANRASLAGIRVDGTVLVDSAPAETDSLFDSPTNYVDGTNVGGNYATLNPLNAASGVTLSNGNLDFTASTNGDTAFGTIGFTSGKFYWEATVTTQANGQLGIETDPSVAPTQFVGSSATSYCLHIGNGNKYNNGGNGTAYTSATAVGDVIGIAVDLDSSPTTLTFYKNGTSLGTAFSGFSGTVIPGVSRTSSSPGFSLNFGQRPFSISSVPTGYKSLCTQNLDDPLIEDPSTAFDVALWAGNGSSAQTLSTPNLSPDMVWYKERSSTSSHGIVDSVRGATNAAKVIYPDRTDAEVTANATQSITSLNSNGFTIGSSDNSINESNQTYVGWAWDGGDLATNSVYNQSQVWSSNQTGTFAGDNQDLVFNGELSTDHLTGRQRPSNGTTAGYTFSNLGTVTSLKVWVHQSGTGGTVFTINNTDVTTTVDAATNSSFVDFGSTFSSLTSIAFNAVDGSNWYSVAGIEVNGKLLVDTGVIPVGSLHSSAYNQSVVWSNGMTVSSGSITDSSNAFNGDTGDFAVADAFSTDIVVNLGNTLDGVLEVYGSSGATHDVNGQTKLEPNASGWHKVGTCTSGTTTTYTCAGASNAYAAIRAIRVAGKVLVDQGTTPAVNVPSIASTTRANPTAGFSIVSYKGNLQSDTTVGHGLNAEPYFIIIKERDSATQNWNVYHKNVGNTKAIFLNLTTDSTTSSAWSNTTPASSVFTVGAQNGSNGSGKDIIAYCFAPVEGYSAFGLYEGNGSTDGPFVYTGFRPKFVLLKNADNGSAGYDWHMNDTERDSYNVSGSYLNANKNDAEATFAAIDFLSNGFKLVTNGASYNASANTFIFAAFAEHPFKTARAR